MDMVVVDRSLESAISKSLSAIWRQKLAFILATVVFFSASTIAILSIQSVYEGETLLVSGQASLEQSANGIRPLADNEALAQIAQSNEVVRAAITQIGVANLVDKTALGNGSKFAGLRTLMFGASAEMRRVPSAVDAALPIVKRRLDVRSSVNSNVLSIAFRHVNPVIAANFVNAIAQGFIDRHIAINSRPGAAEFFSVQKERFDEEFKQAANELERLATQNGLYSIDQQRELLVKRLSDSEATIAANRAAISNMLGQRQMLADQLRKLAPVAQNPFVAGIVESLSGDRDSRSARSADTSATDDWMFNPPLLLVRVYQDSMVKLFSINAEIAGMQNLEDQQQEEQAKLRADLDRISEYTQRVEDLRRTKNQAALNSELYTKRMIEEQINAEVHKARFSSVKILERANVPTKPAFPNYKFFIAATTVFSVMLGIAFALLRSRRS